MEIPVAQAFEKEIDAERQAVSSILEDAFDVQDAIANVHKEMDDCQIPVNIKMRANQIDQLREKLDNLNTEFSELKQADANYEGTTDSEREIKALIEKIDRKLTQLV